jgi:serine protease Do
MAVLSLRAVLAVVGALAVSPAAPAMAGSLPSDEADVIAKLLPEVVNISVVSLEKDSSPVATPASGAASFMRKRSLGSGFIIDPDGLIVTNKHVIEGADEITVILHDDTRLRASLVYKAPIDMAFLKVKSMRKLPAVTWGDSDRMRPGDPVIAIGNPLGLGGSVTAGIVSALDRDIHETPVDSFIQIDAAINHGNSGGPLFNAAGEVIGINTALYSPTDSGSIGLGFAIPGNDAQFIINRFREYGRVRLGWIGVSCQTVTPDIGEGVEMPAPWGSIIATVPPGSPAERAGLQPGDVILRLNGREAKEPRQLNRLVAATDIGETVTLDVWRDRAERQVKAVVEEAPGDTTEAAAKEAMVSLMVHRRDAGLIVSPITEFNRAKFGLTRDQSGVVVTSVVENSVAAAHGVRVGEVIEKVQETPVADAEELIRAFDRARDAGQHHVLVLFQDGAAQRWVALPLSTEQQLSGAKQPG